MSQQEPVCDPLFEVVLHEPEIPNNTGSVGRTCVTLGCALHLVHPLGFDIDEKARRRAGLDYWPRLSVREHADWPGFCDWRGDRRIWVVEPRAPRSVFEVELARGDLLLFGKESVGLPASIKAELREHMIGLPMRAGERSLNLSNAVTATLYEGVRQLSQRGSVRLGPGCALET